MPGHSSIVGGSTADRILNCPGSYQALLALPPAADRPSEYAEEGTAMHVVMAELFLHRQACGPDNIPDLHHLARAWAEVGKVFHDRELTEEHVDTMIFPALLALAELEQQYGNDFIVEAVEKSVKFPNIPGAFGTCDLILSNQTHVLHVDWKFGQGIPVSAIYQDPAGDIVNPQLLFYITAAMSSARHFYTPRKKLVGAIIQPRNDTPLSYTEISRKEVKWFAQDLEKSVITAMERDPPRKKGEWCRFAGCKVNCPLWTAPLLELTTISDKVVERTEMVAAEPTLYGHYLSRAKTLVDTVSIFKKELDEQLHAYLEDGGHVPGWRLKLKAKQRKWIDTETVVTELSDLGFKPEEIGKTVLRTFAETDATAKRLGVEIPSHLREAPPTNETTICRTDDPAPVVHKPLAIEQFRAALKALTS